MAVTCTIDAAGISAPTYSDILAEIQAEYRTIYGADVYLEADSQDGQMLAIFARAISDANAMAVSVYNAFSPASAQGEGLSRVVKINGIARLIASYSTVDLLLGGSVGAVITNGYAQDAEGMRWRLPASVTIPGSGEITVSATAEALGEITGAANTINIISTPTLGWQSVNNLTAATLGKPIEDDADLRRRQTVSVALPSVTVIGGLAGALALITGVTRYVIYENDTSTTDGNGIPEHSIAVVIEGGNVSVIAETIFDRKTPGTYTFGSTSQTVVDQFGISNTIRFTRPTDVPISIEITITALAGYSGTIGAAIRQALVDYINARSIGDDILLSRLFVPAGLAGGTGSETYDITSIEIARDSDPLAAANITIAFDEAASCLLVDVALVVI